MRFAEQTGLSVIVCHYPPYCSKWNPIEHHLFSQVHKAMESVVFLDYQTVQRTIEQTSTKRGLTVVVKLNLKQYHKAIRVDKTKIPETGGGLCPGLLVQKWTKKIISFMYTILKVGIIMN